MKKKLKPLKTLKKKADAVFSKWIRQRDNKCYTCNGNPEQAGHYISRSYLFLRYDERNVHAQCVSCNVFKNGNYPSYAIHLINEYGVGILEELQQSKHSKISNPRQFYEEVIQKYE